MYGGGLAQGQCAGIDQRSYRSSTEVSNGMGDRFACKQPPRPTQPSILVDSVNEEWPMSIGHGSTAGRLRH